MTREDIIRMARKAGYGEAMSDLHAPALERFAELVRADESEKYRWDVHSCGPTCQRYYVCVAMREAVEAEREVCAKVCDEVGNRDKDSHAWDAAAAIRARSKP